MATKPIIILICTEGVETERAFLKQVMKVYHISKDIIKFEEGQGAHKTLIDNCVKRRAELSTNEEISEDYIEVWAMCDRDGFYGQYATLKKYADSKKVKLAFSSPQFESFIIQLFEPFKRGYKGNLLKKELSKHLKKTTLQDGSVLGTIYSKTDLRWVGKLLSERHSMLKTAIKNADRRKSQTGKVFLTVQRLIERILESKT
jgi:hypothetical protein